MSMPSNDSGDFAERVIDTSGDIDQRPPEERISKNSTNIVPIRSSSVHGGERGGVSRLPASFGPEQRISSSTLKDSLGDKLQKRVETHRAKAQAQLEAIARKIDAQEKRFSPPKLDDDLQKVRFQRQKILIANGPLLVDVLKQEQNHFADLKHFQAENGLTREPTYPSSQVFALSILIMLILVEACVNGVLFAENSESGLLGGWLEALVLAFSNVGIAFLLGRLVLPQFNARRWFMRLFALVAALAGVCLLLMVNLLGAHYRDYKAELTQIETQALMQKLPAKENRPANLNSQRNVVDQKSSPSASPILPKSLNERDVLKKVLENPLNLQSFTSFFLLVIGLCAAVIAAWDGYKLDDPFPGYGARHRRYVASRSKSAEALKRVLSQANTLVTESFSFINKKLDSFAHDILVLQNLHNNYSGERERLQTLLYEDLKKADAELSQFYRQQKRQGQALPSEYEALALAPLDQLHDKHVKYREQQERKLSILQKAVFKEQNALLDIFEAASLDFEKLMREAAQANVSMITFQSVARS